MPRLLHLAAAALIFVSSPAIAAQDASVTGPVYLVYAGPYSASPSSAFGHLFLAMAASVDEPPPLWDVITFNAETFGADPLRYLTIGIKGGFLGRYSRVQFHEKTREYGVLADRDLWLVELDLSDSERRELEKVLEEREDDWLPYTFFSRNCAFYLQSILAEVTAAVPAPSGVTSPISVLQAVQNSPLGGEAFFLPALSQRLLRMANGLGEMARARLASGEWRVAAADTAWHKELNGYERRFLLEFLSLRLEETNVGLSKEEVAGLASLRVGAATDGPLDETPYPTSRREPLEAPRFHDYTRLRFAQGVDAQREARTHVQIRGAMHGASDPWYGHRPITTLDLLSLQISSATRELRPRLESLVLFSQRALAPGDWIRSRASWLLELQARRGGLFSEHGTHFELRAGSGGTWTLPLGIHAYALATTGVVGDWGEGIDLAPGLEIGLLARPLETLRFGGRVTHERRLTDWPTHHTRWRFWGKCDLGSNWGVTLRWHRVQASNSWVAGLDWYL